MKSRIALFAEAARISEKASVSAENVSSRSRMMRFNGGKIKMIRIKKDKFSAGGVCFSLPDGFFIDPHPQVMYEDGMSLYSPDMSYDMIFFAGRYEEESAYTHLSNYIADNDFTIIEPIRTVMINNMIGYSALYHSDRYSYYETVLDTPAPTEEFNVFVVRCTIEGVDDETVSELKNSKAINIFLESIYPDE